MKIKTPLTLFISAFLLLYGCAHAEAEWPVFRGPKGDGTVIRSTLPLKWSETENISWKTAIPQLGWSTPVVEDGRIWLTSATKDGQDYFVHCIDAESGKILIEKQLFHYDNPEPLGNSVNCYASPSPAIEQGRVYIHFGSYGTACLESKSDELIWKRTDLKCRHYRGPASSPIIYKNLLILTFDGVDLQYLIALDKKSGQTVWKSKRDIEWKDLDADGNPKREGDFRKAYTTPLVINVGGKEQLISPASSAVIAYEPDTGQEIWKTVNDEYTPSITPVFAGGLVMTATGRGAAEMQAIRPDGKGDVTDSHMIWSIRGKDVPLTPSPVVVNGLLYMLSDSGALSCVKVKTGKVIWREKLGGSYIASPIHDGKRIYFSSTSGKTTVVSPGRNFKTLAENKLDDGFMASPAVDGNALILRTKTHLYRVEN